MEAVVLKATLAKGKQQEAQREAAERKSWQLKAGVKTVTATPPEGGW